MPGLGRRRAAQRRRCLLLLPLFGLLLAPIGCAKSPSPQPKEIGTTANFELPDGDPPILTKAMADQIVPGLPQDVVLAYLQEAARDTPSAASSLEVAAEEAKLNKLRYDLTIVQGKRKLMLSFRDAVLVDVKREGLE